MTVGPSLRARLKRIEQQIGDRRKLTIGERLERAAKRAAAMTPEALAAESAAFVAALDPQDPLEARFLRAELRAAALHGGPSGGRPARRARRP